MNSGIELINKIDQVLNELGITRKDFADKIELAPSTMATWKTKDILPSVDTLLKIASALKVSVEWLLSDSSDFEKEDENYGPLSRKSIRDRIYNSLIKKTGDTDCDWKELHNRYLEGDVSYETLLNWSKGRCNIDFFIFQLLSMLIGTNIQYILTGTTDCPSDFDPLLYKEAEENMNAVHCLYNLSDDKKKIVGDMLNKLMELEHLEHVSKKQL